MSVFCSNHDLLDFIQTHGVAGRSCETAQVVVGPLFEEDRDPLESGVPVPSGFFCIVVDVEEGGDPRALAFIMPRKDERVDELRGFLTTVDEIESRAGLDFFHLLPDSVENALERTGATDLWALPVSPN